MQSDGGGGSTCRSSGIGNATCREHRWRRRLEDGGGVAHMKEDLLLVGVLGEEVLLIGLNEGRSVACRVMWGEEVQLMEREGMCCVLILWLKGVSVVKCMGAELLFIQGEGS